MTPLRALVFLLAASVPGTAPATPVVAAADRSAAPTLVQENASYDGRFTFVRLRFQPELRGGGFFGDRTPPWAHDYPRAERNLMRLLDEITLMDPHLDASNILDQDDPELHKYPVAYLCEPGFWSQTPAEVAGLRNYLLKGGFLIVDDFRGGDLYNFETEIRRVLPGAQLVEMDVTHPLFHSFFQIESLDFSAPTFRRFKPVYYGIFQDNDPRGRLLAIVNYNNDIGDYWEFSDSGWYPVELSNEAYKLGINYILYALTH